MMNIAGVRRRHHCLLCQQRVLSLDPAHGQQLVCHQTLSRQVHRLATVLALAGDRCDL